MIQFDDFDAWGDAINGASLRLACDGVETRGWVLGALDLSGVVLQIAWEGGGTLCYGGNTHPGPILFVPLTHAAEHVVNGERLDDDSLLGRPGGTAAHLAAGRELTAAAMGCSPVPEPTPLRIGRPRLDRAEIVRRAMAMIDSAAIVPTASALASHIGVTNRTLLRTFQEAFGVPPRQYLILRELHAVRRSLRGSGSEDATVADVLTRHGIWEFGRFAARYRRHFGESPSVTLARARS